MADLSASDRRALPSSTFAGPNRSFPIPDAKHARAALMLINKAPASARAKIRARANAKLGNTPNRDDVAKGLAGGKWK